MKKKILFSPLITVILIIVFGVGVAGAAIYFGGAGGTEEVNLQKGLIVWLKMDGNTKDSSPNNSSITNYGATLTTDRKGQENKAYKFNDNLETLTMNYRVWKDGQTGSVGLFSTSGSGNSRTLADDPWGRKVVVWKGVPDAGIYYTAQPIDNTKMYRMSWWEQRVTNGTATYARYYAGLNGYGTTNGVYYRSDATTLSTNPYFYNTSDIPTAGQLPVATWVLVVGHIYPAGSGAGAMHDDSGRWLLSGAKLGNNSRDFIWHSATTTGRSRTLAIYQGNQSDVLHYTVYPRLDIVDGTEPSLAELIAGDHDTYGNDIQVDLSETPVSYSFWYKEASESSWTHVVNSSGTYYVNGQLGTPTYNPVTVDGNTVYVGRTDMSNWFTGSMDEVKVYNRTLSAAEVTELYNEYESGIVISDLQKGLMGWWKMNGTAKDSTPNVNHGTVTGATLSTDRKGQVDKAYSLNGTSNRISIPRSQIFATANMTISAWINANNFTQWKGLIYLREDDTSNYLIIRNNGSALQLLIEDDNDAKVNMATSALPTSAWIQAVFTQDGGGWKFYLNGQQGTFTGTNSAYSSDHLTINNIDIGYSAWAESYFSGSIDDVRIYNRALSSTEITALYDEYDPGIVMSDLQKGLMGWWKFDGYAKDSTPNANHGTVTGATLTTDRKGQVNKAYLLNGSTDYINTNNAFETTGSSTTKTMSMWVKSATANYTTRGRPISMQRAAASSLFIFTADGNPAVWSYWYNTAPTTVTQRATAVTVSTTTWQHLVLVQNGANITFYVNGVLQGSNSDAVAPTMASPGNTFIGAYSNSGTPDQFWNGSVDDVRIWNRALSQAEVTALYESY